MIHGFDAKKQFPNFQRVYHRLLEVKEVKDGWYNGQGKGPTEKAYGEAYRLICSRSDGGIFIEFFQEGIVVIEISPDGISEEIGFRT